MRTGTVEALRDWVAIGAKPAVDLLYIDADHTYTSTVVYWALGGLLVRPGGWVIFDDIANPICPDVADVWHLAQNHPEWHNAEEWHNWGLIQKR